MIWWFILPATGSLFWDGPWLIVAMGLQWVLRIGIIKWAMGVFVAELLILGTLEWMLYKWQPSHRLRPRPRCLLKESWVLVTLSLLLSPIPGFIAWQASVGLDAAAKVHGLNQSVMKIFRVRIIKCLLIIVLALLILWSEPWS